MLFILCGIAQLPGPHRPDLAGSLGRQRDRRVGSLGLTGQPLVEPVEKGVGQAHPLVDQLGVPRFQPSLPVFLLLLLPGELFLLCGGELVEAHLGSHVGVDQPVRQALSLVHRLSENCKIAGQVFNLLAETRWKDSHEEVHHDEVAYHEEENEVESRQ